MTEEEVKRLWDKEWHDNATVEDSASPVGCWLRRQRLKIVSKLLQNVDKKVSIIDMGCGGGSTLMLFRNLGFKNSIGIDFSGEAIKRCEALGFEEGIDVFNYDARDTPYLDKEFDIVFEEGLWEHFVDPTEFIVEACRISKNWLLIIQPDHFTPFGWLLHQGWLLFKGGGVKEYSFRMSYFIKHIQQHGFELHRHCTTRFQEQSIILFRRVN